MLLEEATTQNVRGSVAAFAEAANETKIMRNIFSKNTQKIVTELKSASFGRGRSESSIWLLFFLSVSLLFFSFFFLCYFAIFSHVVHVYKMRRVLSIFITQTPLHLPPHRAALPPFRTVFKNRLQVKFCSFCSKFFIKKMSCRWFRLLSPCESLLNDRFVIMRHLRNFYMNSLNELTFERASILTMRAAPSLRCGIVIISATTVSIQLILN